MKTKIIFFLITASVFLGCKKILDKPPVDSLSPVNYYRTESELDAALNGVYNLLGKNYATTKLHHFNFDADAGYATSNAAVGVHMNNTSYSDVQVIREWNILYEGVNAANMLLDNVDNNPNINIDIRNRIRGEALFLRAFFYLELAKIYGGVPLRLTATISPKDVAFPRSTALEVYKQVEADMKTALPLVWSIKQAKNGGRVNKSAVRALLARVNLYMAGNPINDNPTYRMGQVEYWTNEIITDTEASHDLNPSYAQVFINYAADIYDPKESIWEVEYQGNLDGTFNETGQVGVANGIPSANPETGLATGGLNATGYLFDKFKNDDTRKYWCIPHFSYAGSATAPVANGEKTYPTSPYSQANKWTRPSGKFRREFEKVTPKGRYASPQNFPIVRFSDVLLMHAEAINELRGPADAAPFLYKVRKRSWSTGISSLQMVAQGTGYNASNPPIISFSGGGGTGIQARPVISSGRISRIDILYDGVNSQGRNYVSAPNVVISGGVGSGAVYTAVMPDPNGADVTSAEMADSDSFKKAIQDERLFELCFETHRKFDLIRWGIYNTRIAEVGVKFTADAPTSTNIKKFTNVSSRDVLWPIPINEMMLNPAIGKQNFGW